MASLHSGSIRYYGLRETLRWDRIPPGMLAGTWESLRDHGYATYLALDGPSEVEPFRIRFAGELGRVTLTPTARVREVDIFALGPP